GRNSSNTKRLYEMGKNMVETHHIEIPEEINYKWINGDKIVGISTGASTPNEITDKICKKILLYKNKQGKVINSW
ncbi:MAG: hypothetical protein ACOC5T_04960, partial [Elusimicrobiota bacterium]